MQHRCVERSQLWYCNGGITRSSLKTLAATNAEVDCSRAGRERALWCGMVVVWYHRVREKLLYFPCKRDQKARKK